MHQASPLLPHAHGAEYTAVAGILSPSSASGQSQTTASRGHISFIVTSLLMNVAELAQEEGLVNVLSRAGVGSCGCVPWRSTYGGVTFLRLPQRCSVWRAAFRLQSQLLCPPTATHAPGTPAKVHGQSALPCS